MEKVLKVVGVVILILGQVAVIAAFNGYHTTSAKTGDVGFIGIMFSLGGILVMLMGSMLKPKKGDRYVL